MDTALHSWLNDIVGGSNDDIMKLKVLVKDHELLDQFNKYFKDTIPTTVFKSCTPEQQKTINTQWQSLQDNFITKGHLPFTMQRICELIFDPLKYFQPTELNKYIHAMDKCINVVSIYEFDINSKVHTLLYGIASNTNKESSLLDCDTLNTNGDGSNITDDVSMSKIPFLQNNDDELKIRKEYNEFLREIDSVMSINYEYDDEDDEDYIEENTHDLNENNRSLDEDYIEGDEDEDMDDDEDDDEEEELIFK